MMNIQSTDTSGFSTERGLVADARDCAGGVW